MILRSTVDVKWMSHDIDEAAFILQGASDDKEGVYLSKPFLSKVIEAARYFASRNADPQQVNEILAKLPDSNLSTESGVSESNSALNILNVRVEGLVEENERLEDEAVSKDQEITVLREAYAMHEELAEVCRSLSFILDSVSPGDTPLPWLDEQGKFDDLYRSRPQIRFDD